MKVKKTVLLICTVISSSVFIISCTKIRDAVPRTSDCSISTAKFSMDVSPIIQSNCAINSGCHGAGSVNGPGPLTGYSQISRVATDIKDAVVSGRMPLGSSLSSADIQKIVCWTNSGTLNN